MIRGAFAVLLVAAVIAQNPVVELSFEAPASFLTEVNVTLSWKLTQGQFNAETDWVSVWWVPFASTYVQYANVTANTGSANFSLINARHAYVFRYYRGDAQIAQSAQLTPDGTYPMQVHSMFVPKNADSVMIQWVSNRTTGTEVVFFGLSPDNLDSVNFNVVTNSYTHEEINTRVGLPPIPIRTTPFDNIGLRKLRCSWGECYNDFTASQLFVDPGQLHHVELTNLPADSILYYQVGEADGWLSQVFSTHTRVSSSQPIQVLYVADAGVGDSLGGFEGGACHNDVPVPPINGSEGARHVWDALKADPDSVNDQVSVMNGDISYARGWPFVWERFHAETTSVFSRAPVLATIGNHEWDWANNEFYMFRGPDSGGECGIPTLRRFPFLNETRPWYIISVGPITFVGLSTEHSIAEQAEWMSNVLPLVNRTITPWLIVIMHRPIHMSSTWVDWEMSTAMGASYTPMFAEYGVDLVLAGHAHYYERMCAISNGVCANWNFRDVWTTYAKTSLVGAGKCTHKFSGNNYTIEQCRVKCNYRSGCTGVYLGSKGECFWLTCQQPFRLQYDKKNTVYSLARRPGRPPVYIVDGTAGGVFTDASTPKANITEYKDFEHWGYSRIKADHKSLTWLHYHIDGSIRDQVTLTPQNVEP